MSIQIKSRFGEWRTVSALEARVYILNTFDRITNLSDAEKITHIEKNNLRGTSIVKLFSTETRSKWSL